MKNMIYLGVIIIAAAILIGYFILKSREETDRGPSDYFIATEGESADRVSALGLDKASEDARHILDASRLNMPAGNAAEEDEEYKADPEREWIIMLEAANSQPFQATELAEVFDYDWRNRFESELYGLSSADKKWTFAFSADSPDRFDKLQIAVDLQHLFEEDTEIDPGKLSRYLPELEKRLAKLSIKVLYSPAESVASAAERADKLMTLAKTYDREAVIVLQGDKPFNGMDVWDMLQSLGLEWGDGDLFHWNNETGYGAGEHFSVVTATPPGYFLPEDIKSGEMNPENLVFSFSVPRSADAVNIFSVMTDAVQYAQKRLGGKILNGDGEVFNKQKEIQDLTQFVGRMKAAGVEPGSDQALRMFW